MQQIHATKIQRNSIFSQTVHFWDKLYEGPGFIFWIICFAFSACNFFVVLRFGVQVEDDEVW